MSEIKAEDNPNATLAELTARAWELEHMKRQRDNSTVNSITALAIRQHIETLKRELGRS
jgi:hypothetical protein